MKGDRLGEFEELTLLAVRAIKGEAYGVPVQRFVEKAAGRTVTMAPSTRPFRGWKPRVMCARR